MFATDIPRRAGLCCTAIPVALIILGGICTELSAQATYEIRGRVTEPDGAPIAGAEIWLDDTRPAAETDADGAFAISDVAPGRYRLRIERLGYAPRAIWVRVGPAVASTLAIALTPRPFELEGLTAIGSRSELAEIRQRMQEIPGAVRLIEPEELRNTRQANFDDVLKMTPGVYVAPRFGAADESQLSIRGSGLRNNFHLRGVNVLINGMPYRNADGFTDFESLELLTTENIQVYKGGNALRFGASTLGGAINLETKTGYSASPVKAFAQGGSYGFLKAQGSTGAVLGNFDYYASYVRTQLDGYRDFSEQRRDRVNAHVGYVFSPKLDARAFYLFAYVEEDLPGSLTAEEFAADPRQANATNVEDRWGRDYSLHHVGVQLRSQLSPTQRLEIAPYGQFRDIVHPIFRVLDQVSRDVGVEVRYQNSGQIAGRTNRFTIGFQPAYGDLDNRQFENVGGERGDLAKDQDEDAASIALYAEDAFGLTPKLTAVLGLRYERSLRRIDDAFPDDGDQSDERWFAAAMPKLGLIYDVPAIGGQLFANASRIFEPPLLLELNSFTVPGFIDLDAQDAWQFEVGTRGRLTELDWSLALYDIELRDEIININVQPFPGAPFTVPTYRNSERTRHYGLELGLGYEQPLTLLAKHSGGDRLGLRLAYTFARYEYVEDAQFDNNDIPGAPEHVLQAALTYRHPVGLSIQPNLQWVPADYFVDSGNTARNDGWAVLGLRADYTLPRVGGTAFIEVRNLTDEVHSPAINVDDASGRFFQPADGRSLYAGVRWQP